MNNYFFFVGRHPKFSLAELSSYFKSNGFLEYNDTFIKVRCDCSPKEIIELMPRLGGIIKISHEILVLDKKENLANSIIKYLQEYFTNTTGKKKFGISSILNNYPLKTLLNSIKRLGQNQKLQLRFVNKNFTNLSSAQVYKEKLCSNNGIEINLISQQNQINLSQTIAIQDLDNYSKRDYEKPGRDAKRGMTPPKLAQIMLNLTHLNEKTTIWDPFCGTGVILMEALLMNYNSLGSDIDERAIELSQNNILWLYENYGFNSQSIIWPHNACQNLNKNIQIDAIVTEPFLGPPLSQPPNQELLSKITANLENLYLDFFDEIYSFLHNDSKIIIILPCWKTKEGLQHFKITNKIKNLGYKIIPLIPEELSEKFNFRNYPSLIYGRPDQIVNREIFCFEKN